MSQPSTKKRQRPRPCDACAIRRVKCDIDSCTGGICSNCLTHKVPCTNLRVRHKSGPKKSTRTVKNTEDLNDEIYAQSTLPAHVCAFSLKQIIPYLEIYHSNFYDIWPVVSIQSTVSILTRSSPLKNVEQVFQLANVLDDFRITIAEDNAQEYALCCALCATIAQYHSFVTYTPARSDLKNAGLYAQEARRIIYEYRLKSTPNIDLLLTSFFLHKYYAIAPGQQHKGLIYLREAVSLADILKMHEPQSLLHLSPVEAHRQKKIYYLLVVTERFVSFKTNLPVLLEPSIPLPEADFEKSSNSLYGFTTLCAIFSATDKQFYVELHTKVLETGRTHNMFQIPETNLFQDFTLNGSTELKRLWLLELQQKLQIRIDVDKIATSAQKVNVIVSKAWLQSLGWLIASANFLISSDESIAVEHECFKINFPLKVANELLSSLQNLPDHAFRCNGPDISMKLLEIADSLYILIKSYVDPATTELAYERMGAVFDMVLKYKAGMDLPRALFTKISKLLESWKVNGLREICHNLSSEFSSYEPALTRSGSLVRCNTRQDSALFNNSFSGSRANLQHRQTSGIRLDVSSSLFASLERVSSGQFNPLTTHKEPTTSKGVASFFLGQLGPNTAPFHAPGAP
ncbi:hypothetical protein KL918_003521 [Ogataea parapolymorpha]|uniref:Sucrose utilization protein SUC1 n=1 Tax=Ogataea parapolymorpha (strain ATCC 26012 / BCRC 20466 / JCM 22074 / NRRL Y-7560 / DL-1) TaxID=871575 RepID=W1Q7R2_OGAPD|nr:sucrose utilization protein SUC1 [Ogataea parapolymorpha DL-1]ESW95961.1 sucrose utilization protein SUC1 [Ogataea parapolymorpha DL-1]KAG7866624.1 hypothetical protein KL918_003521 [Ogataea parapolymorpha]KAG7871159.1 hypothetical protein KL916_004347 [Ogataea parapolymorpha]